MAPLGEHGPVCFLLQFHSYTGGGRIYSTTLAVSLVVPVIIITNFASASSAGYAGRVGWLGCSVSGLYRWSECHVTHNKRKLLVTSRKNAPSSDARSPY